MHLETYIKITRYLLESYIWQKSPKYLNSQTFSILISHNIHTSIVEPSLSLIVRLRLLFTLSTSFSTVDQGIVATSAIFWPYSYSVFKLIYRKRIAIKSNKENRRVPIKL